MAHELVKTRFAPSPTGHIHMGNARTALFSALLAQHHGGPFLLRIEDTDAVRSEETYIHDLVEDLHWLGIRWQEGEGVGGEHAPYRQAERSAVYAKYYQMLLDKGMAYECYKTDADLEMMRKVQRASGQAPRYPKSWREQSAEEIAAKKAQGVKPTLRFKVPDGATVEFTDLLKGQQRFQSDDIGDFVIRKADGSPAFMFCNAIDDSLMGVSHVVRGEDHLTNTPRQLMILDALGMRRPEYIHIAIILGMDGQPLSKRNGSHSIRALRQMGYLPNAVANYMARLGHYYADNTLMDFVRLAEHFNVNSLVKSAAKYDENQLNFWQKTALQAADDQVVWRWMGGAVHALVPEDKQPLFIQTIRDNVIFPDDALRWAELLFTDEFALTDEAQKVTSAAGTEFFDMAIDAVKTHGADFDAISRLLQAEGIKGKALFQPLRLALTGQLHGPKMAGLVELIGAERCMQRLQAAKPKVLS